MKSVFRAAAVASAVVATLMSVSYRPSAQDASGEAPKAVTREYEVAPLVQRELELAPRTGGIGDVLAPDRLFYGGPDHGEDDWSLRESGDEARCWDTPYDLAADLAGFISDASDNGDSNYAARDTKIAVTASEPVQKQYQWLLDAINDVRRAKVGMVVYRLKDGADVSAPVVKPADVADWTNGARCMGNFRGGLGEPFVLQQTQHRSYVADYDISVATNAASASPVVHDLSTGNEFVFGAVSLSDGRLWLQGWHASMTLKQMRSVATAVGKVELPDVAYSFTPISAVIENGGAAVIDAGPGNRFLVTAHCDRTIKNREMKLADGTRIRLINCVGAMRGQALGGFWLMQPNSSQMLNDSVLDQVFMEDNSDGPYRDAAANLADRLQTDWISLSTIGPYLGVIERGEVDDADKPARDADLARINAIPATPRTACVRITAFEVADDAALPGGVLNGRPSKADVAEVKALAGGKAKFDRVSANLLLQQLDQYDVELATHLRDYDSISATGVTALDPVIGTLVLGQQMRWQARPAEDGRLHIELRSGITVGSTDFRWVSVGKDGQQIESSRSALTQARLADELAVGERTASLTPAVGADGHLVVIVVERLQ